MALMMITAVSTQLRRVEADLNADEKHSSLCETGLKETGNMFTRHDNIQGHKQSFFFFFF